MFSDGTNNKGGVTHDTNVWRLYQMIDRSGGDQCTFYDDGVGTQDFAPIKAISGAFGYGLSANIRSAYTFLVRNYEPGDFIYMFGFSRGAYTVRSLAGFISRCGLVNKRGWPKEQVGVVATAELEMRIGNAFAAYRSTDDWPSTCQRHLNLNPVLEFIGVWDTVDAVGLPLDELKPIFGWAYEKLCHKRAYRFRDRVVSGTRFARQALSIDDERRTFHPNVWLQAGCYLDEQEHYQSVDLKQVWFTGVHSNIGGSYPKDGLAYITLEWMIGELESTNGKAGTIRIQSGAISDVNNLANQADKLYDSRRGLASYYRYSPRHLERFARGIDDFYIRMCRYLFPARGEQETSINVHVSVLDRIQQGTKNYAPLFINDANGPAGIAFTNQSASRFRQSRYSGPIDFLQLPDLVTKKLERLVLMRQVAYYFFFTFTLIGLGLGLFTEAPCEFGGNPGNTLTQAMQCNPLSERDFVNWSASVVKSLVPALLERVVDNAYSYYRISALIAALVLLGYTISRYFKHKIAVTARAAWDTVI